MCIQCIEIILVYFFNIGEAMHSFSVYSNVYFFACCQQCMFRNTTILLDYLRLLPNFFETTIFRSKDEILNSI